MRLHKPKQYIKGNNIELFRYFALCKFIQNPKKSETFFYLNNIMIISQPLSSQYFLQPSLHKFKSMSRNAENLFFTKDRPFGPINFRLPNTHILSMSTRFLASTQRVKNNFECGISSISKIDSKPNTQEHKH